MAGFINDEYVMDPHIIGLFTYLVPAQCDVTYLLLVCIDDKQASSRFVFAR